MKVFVKRFDRAGKLAASGDVGARLMLVLLCFVWGATWPIMKIALEQIPPLAMRTASTALGALTLYLICIFTRRSLRIRTAKAWTHVVIASLLNIVGFSVLSAFAQLAAATSRVAILAYTMPVWSVLLAWMFLGERPTGAQTVALGLCAAGLALLIYPLAATGVPLGILLAVATGLTWAAGTVYLKWARIDADSMGVASWQMTIAFVVIGACMMLFERPLDLGAVHADALFATAVVGVGANGIAYGLWFSVVRRLPAVTASLGVLGSPVIGVVTSILILGERPSGADIAGFALILAACTCVMLGPAARPEGTERDLDAPPRA